MSWYIDRSRNLSSLFTSEWYSKLVKIALDTSKRDVYKNKSNDLCNELNLSGKNPFAVLTYLRDIGVIDDDNNATDFFVSCIKAKLSHESIILLMLLKRNSNKDEKSTIKPFVVICKALYLMNKYGYELKLNWHQCIDYLMPIKDYHELNELLIRTMCSDLGENPSNGLDIWFNALIATGMFSGRNNEIRLNDEYFEFVAFISKYGEEMSPNKTREDYLQQAQDSLYGFYKIVKSNPFEAIVALGRLSGVFEYITVVYREFDDKIQFKNKIDESKRKRNGVNIILYGVPGAGKSYTITHDYVGKNTKMERVVFHPDYTYSDFVGQILPKSHNGDVSYQFMPGPFTTIMKEAFNTPETSFVLVIEEINRGNAPAIFGDIFQLLDRDNSIKIKDSNGQWMDNPQYLASSYGIVNADMAKIVYGNEEHEVKIPSNMSIICTMNTADQNVFTLDTAFQRRWNMRLIENVFRKDTPEEKDFAEHTILDTNISWEDFCEAINKLILEKNQNMTSSEDKRLGTHFVNIEDLIYDNNEDNTDISNEERTKAKLSNRRFPEKVIKYLWDDAFKFSRDVTFKDGFDSLEKIIREFAQKRGNDRFSIFKDAIKAAIEEKSNKTPQN